MFTNSYYFLVLKVGTKFTTRTISATQSTTTMPTRTTANASTVKRTDLDINSRYLQKASRILQID